MNTPASTASAISDEQIDAAYHAHHNAGFGRTDTYTGIRAFTRRILALAAPTAQPVGQDEERDFDAEMAAIDSGPPLIGRWHHGNGVLVSGGIRIAQWDCDTNPPTEFRERVLDWMCESLNSAVRAAVEPSQPAPDDDAIRTAFREADARNPMRNLTPWQIWREAFASNPPAPAPPSLEESRASFQAMLKTYREQRRAALAASTKATK